MELEAVLHVWIHQDNDLIDLTITTQTTVRHGSTSTATMTREVIHTNKKHPFFTIEQGFLAVSKITVGMHLLRGDGRVGVVTGWKVVPGTKMMYNLEVQQDHTFTVGVGQWVVHNDCGPVNSKGEPYPKMVDPRTGQEVPFPQGDIQSVPVGDRVGDRVEWNGRTRGEFIKEWIDSSYPVPNGGWNNVDIHHILPREFGGTNDFWNLVPIDRDFHQQIVTPWWNSYVP